MYNTFKKIDKTECILINKILLEHYTTRKEIKYFSILEVSKQIYIKLKKKIRQ